METIKDKMFSGERPLFETHDTELVNVTIGTGESALKECSNIVARDCRFEGKYPFWHVDGFKIERCLFTEGARAALWYSRNVEMKDTLIEAPKMFRMMDGIALENVKIPNAQETLWDCRNIRLRNVVVENADYIFMHCENVDIKDYRQDGNYSFQYVKNATIRNAVLNSRDALWNTENVTVYDSEINGEFIGWYSKNLKLVNCRISGTQPLCYISNLVMINCTMAEDCDRCFEDSEIYAAIDSEVTSIVNPRSGFIKAHGIGELIVDKNVRNPADCEIITAKE